MDACSIAHYNPFTLSWSHKSHVALQVETIALSQLQAPCYTLTAMSFKPGNYTLQLGPVTGVGGLYATGDGVNKMVILAARDPPTDERQVVSTNPPLLDEMAHVLLLPVAD